MANEIKRMNYYNGLLLKEEDMILEQNYHTRLHRMHNGCFHNWGIVVGLELQKIEGAPQIVVSQGLALDCIKENDGNAVYGQEIYIVDNHPDNPLDLSQYSPKDDIYITVCYEEAKSDPDTLKGDEEIHIWERAKINHGNKKPEDPKKDIVLGRVKLTLDEAGHKIVDYISYEDIEDDQGVQLKLRKDAAPLGGDLRTSKLSVGPREEEDLDLPYICGLVDENTSQVNGLDVRSPLTRFTGSVQSGSINAVGNMDIEGGFTVTQNGSKAVKVNPSGKVDIAGDMEVGGLLSTSNGIAVKGKDATFDTSNVAITGNMVTINKYTPQKDETAPRNQNSGLEVYRGDKAPKATLVWDESQKKWKASVVKLVKKLENDKEVEVEEMEMFDIAYGVSWDNMHNGSHADNMHKHGQIWGTDSNPALNVDNNGNINVSKSLNVSESIVPQKGLAAPSNGTDPAGLIMWDETQKHWQAGTEGNLTNIPYGDDWENLTKGANADLLHTHSQFYNSDKTKVAMKINDAGNIDVPGELTVSEKLTVTGDLNVLGTTTIVNEVKLEVSDHVIVVNKHDNGTPVVTEAGLEVYRGNEPNARLVWDESTNKWRLGTGNALQDIPSGDKWVELTDGLIVEDLHKHSKLCAASGEDVVTVNEQGGADIGGNTKIEGFLAVDSGADIKGTMEVEGSVNIQGNLTVNGVTTTVKTENIEVNDNIIVVNKYKEQDKPLKNEGGLEVYRGGSVDNAKLIWDEASEKWKIGTANDMSEIPYGAKWDNLTGKVNSDSLHSHAKICDSTGNTALIVDEAGDISIEGDADVKGSLNVKGAVNIDGNLIVSGTTIKKDEMEVKDNLIVLNKYEGPNSPVNQSGIEVYRGETAEKARIIWDDDLKKWRIGIGNQLQNIVYGDLLDELTGKLNADSLHLHSQMYNANGDILAVTASAAGNTDVLQNLNVGKNLTVNGNVDVRGKTTTINSEKLDVRGNVITVNKYDEQDVGIKTEGGLEVYRGGKDPNAQIIWDEDNDQWEIGITGKPLLTVKSDGSIEASGPINTDSINIKKDGLLLVKGGLEIPIDAGTKAQIYWDNEYNNWKLGTNLGTGVSISKEGNVGIGMNSPDPKYRLNVSGDANISGKAIVNDITINNSMNLNGDLVLENGYLEGKGFRTKFKDSNQNDTYAKIYWDENKGKWFMGVGDQDSEVPTLNHNHNKLYGEDGKNIIVNVGNKDFVGICNPTPQAELDVTGDVKISGSLDVKKGLQISLEGSSKAKLYWDTNKGKWQIGVDDRVSDIITGAHTHSSLSNDNGDVSVKVESDGSVIIGAKAISVDSTGNAAINKNLTVGGNLTVNGEVVSISTKTLEVEDNIIQINNYPPQQQPIEKDSGLEVFRGGTAGSAKLIWNETQDKWQAGVGDKLTGISLEGHTHKISALNTTDGSKEVVSVDDKGNVTVVSGLEIKGKANIIDAAITGGLTVKDITITGSFTAKDLAVTGILKADEVAVNKGMAVTIADGKKATLGWNALSKKWEAGDGAAVNELSLKGHTHSAVHTKDGSIEAVSVDDAGNVVVAKNLDIKGKANLNEAVITGSLTFKDMAVTGKLTVDEVTVNKGMAVTLPDNKKATLGWNSVSKKWEAGDGTVVSEISLAGHTHKISTVYTKDGSKEAVSVDDTGNVTVVSGLDIKGKANIIDAAVAGSLTVKDMAVTGKLTVSEVTVDKGMAVTLADNKKATLGWNAVSKKWEAGDGTAVSEISLAGHTHKISTVYTKDGSKEAVSVDGAGNVAIGKTPDANTGYMLDIAGQVCAAKFTQRSSKDNYSESLSLDKAKAIELLSTLSPVLFKLKNDSTGKQNIGFVAEDVNAILKTADGKSISLADIIGVLTLMVKEQQTEVSTLQTELGTLKTDVAALKASVAALQNP